MSELQRLGADGAGVAVFTPGRPRTKGSLRPTHRKTGPGRCTVGLREDGEYSVPWKRAMIAAIRAACVCERYEGAVRVDTLFLFDPVVEDGGGLPWPIAHSIGDEDKLRRNALDALTQSGLILDDALVVGVANVSLNGKQWRARGQRAGAFIGVTPA